MMKKIFVLGSLLLLLLVVEVYVFQNLRKDNIEIIGIEQPLIIGCDNRNLSQILLDDVYVNVNGVRGEAAITVENQDLLERLRPRTITYVAHYGNQIVKQTRSVRYLDSVITIDQTNDFIINVGEDYDINDYFSVTSLCNCDANLVLVNADKYQDEGTYDVLIDYNGTTYQTTLTIQNDEVYYEDIEQKGITAGAVEAPKIILKASEIELELGEEFKYNLYVDTIEDSVDTYQYLSHYIRVHNGIDYYTVGEYEVKYLVTNSRGITGEAILKVKVVEPKETEKEA